MTLMRGQKVEYPKPRDLALLHQKQVEAYYQLLVGNVGMIIKVPIPLRGKIIPSNEDYNNSADIWKETKELLTMMGIKHTSFSENFGLRIDE